MNMRSYRLIFLGGIHGTGKGIFCNHLTQVTAWEVLSASELVKWSEYAKDPKNKAVQSIPETQARLLAGLERACKPNGRYLLDGHFTLLDAHNNVTRVDQTIFEAIAPEAILIKTEKASVVQERLQQRDGKTYSLALMEQMLLEEATYSAELARSFNIPYFVVAPGLETESITAIAALQ